MWVDQYDFVETNISGLIYLPVNSRGKIYKVLHKLYTPREFIKVTKNTYTPRINANLKNYRSTNYIPPREFITKNMTSPKLISAVVPDQPTVGNVDHESNSVVQARTGPTD